MGFTDERARAGTMQEHPAFTRFYENLPNKPYCGDDKPAYLIRSKANATKYEYIQADIPGLVSWLTFDLDHPNSLIWEDAGLPAPNLIVRSPATGRSHISYAIKAVCVSRNGRQRPKLYLEAVRKAMALRLNADLQYTGRITKNPFCRLFQTTAIHGYEYELGELADSLELAPLTLAFGAANDEDINGRNCLLFERLRKWSYRSVDEYRTSSNFDAWYTATVARALALNHFHETAFAGKGALAAGECEHIAKSVAKWTWANHHSTRGKMRLDGALPLKARQQLSAQRTASERIRTTEQRIQAGIAALVQDAEVVTQSAVARRIGISRQQINRRYSHLFTENSLQTAIDAAESDAKPLAPCPRPPITCESNTQPAGVTLASHQILAPQGFVFEVQSGHEIAPLPFNAKQIENKPFSPTLIKNSSRSEGNAEKNPFKTLVDLLSAMSRLDDAQRPARFDYKARGRLARVLLAQNIALFDAETLAIDAITKSSDPVYAHMSVSDWTGYLVVSARALQKERMLADNERNARFDAFLNGEQVNVCDSELSALAEYQKNKDAGS